MNEILKKFKESNFNVIYQVYNTYSSNYVLDIIFSFIVNFQNFGLIMNEVVNINLIYIDFTNMEKFNFNNKVKKFFSIFSFSLLFL